MRRTTVVMVFCPAVDVKLQNFLKRQKGILHIMWVLIPKLVRECCPEIAGSSALDPEDVAKMVQHWDYFREVQLADGRMFRTLQQLATVIIMPDTPESHAVANKHLGGYEIRFMPFE